jgi:hypothetical protein
MRLPTRASAAFVSTLALVAVGCGGSSEGAVQEQGAEVPAAPAMTLDDGTAPPLFKVDTGRTMNVAPGQGIGVFVEYAAGGQWHLYWSCDSEATSNACTVDLILLANEGKVGDVKAEGFVASDLLDTSTTPGTIRATTSLTTEGKGLRFTTSPGGVITLGARVRGLQLPDFLFFVEGGSVKGGTATKFTNPAKLAGSTP